MKNIHVLPTENSSRLSYNKDGVLELHRLQWRKNTQHIYITSDEEIKEGDWFITIDTNEIHKSDWIKFYFDNGKKIILTTDQDLIKDGVQAIDDEFLEWFVKNPSCEEVEVKSKITKDGVWTDLKGYVELPTIHSINYKIIIPKEEPKQEKDKKMYSEEEVFELLNNLRLDSYSNSMGRVEFLEWFEEFKKK
jgi:hypothetical protein